MGRSNRYRRAERRGEGVSEAFSSYVERFGEPSARFVGYSGAGLGCERKAVMEVYGLCFCEAHGEQAAASAFEEIYHDLDGSRLLRQKYFLLTALPFRLFRLYNVVPG